MPVGAAVTAAGLLERCPDWRTYPSQPVTFKTKELVTPVHRQSKAEHLADSQGYGHLIARSVLKGA